VAFPIIALLAAAASDKQARAEEARQKQNLMTKTRLGIMQRQAESEGGNPYGIEAANMRFGLNEIGENAKNSRNNNIGSLLQAYLKSDSKTPDKSGGNPDAPLASGWKDDPWGDAGY